MTGESDNTQKALLAAAIAEGTAIANKAMPITLPIGRIVIIAFIAVLCFLGGMYGGDH
jgi:hypothetical protein